MGGTTLRKIRILNGAAAIVDIFQSQSFRCVFVGDMPIFLNGGKPPIVLDLVLIPQPSSQTSRNLIANVLSQHQSTQFKFCVTGNQLRFVDLTGKIPTGKQNWCEVKTSLIQPAWFHLDNVVDICGIPTVHLLVLFINTLQRLGLYNFRPEMLFTKKQIKKMLPLVEIVSGRAVIPQNLDQAHTALSVSKRLVAILSGPPVTSIKHRPQLIDCLRKIVGRIENWVTDHQASMIEDDRKLLLVTQDVDHGPDPNGVVGEDYDEPQADDDWVEVTMSAGEVETQCGERIDDVFDFELLSID